VRYIGGSDTEVNELEENRASKRSFQSVEKMVTFKTPKGAKGANVCFATGIGIFGEGRERALTPKRVPATREKSVREYCRELDRLFRLPFVTQR
jgi:hypothetical protein